jgi:hypothetical protein
MSKRSSDRGFVKSLAATHRGIDYQTPEIALITEGVPHSVDR